MSGMSAVIDHVACHAALPGRSAFGKAAEAVREVAGGLDHGAVKGLCLSAAMHTLLAVDEGGEPLTPSITWGDTRAAPQAERMRESPGVELHRRTGTPLHPM